MADKLTLRLDGVNPLEHGELDGNFVYLDGKVDTGIVNGNTLKWNSTEKKWEQTSALFVDAANTRVGIGVGTNPSAELDVDGDIQCSGKIDGGTF